MQNIHHISGNVIDIENRNIFKAVITISNGIITDISPSENVEDQYILPGFIDAHIHIESSMVTPMEFARIALTHGTVATVSDPHEIANVCGMEGVKFMIDNAREAGLKFFFGAPSCVPATSFEHSGATLNSADVDTLLESKDIYYLSEMMNYPGVLNNDSEVLAKIESAKKYKKPVDGHAPGLRGEDAKKYIEHGITTDHECTSLEEALDKLSHGMKIIIREGSAAKNYNALHPLIASHPDMVMFCSDDKHPDDLIVGHINLLVKKSLSLGYDLFDILKIACLNPVKHYNIPVGNLKTGEPADFIVVSNLQEFEILQTVINGKSLTQNKTCHLGENTSYPINTFNITGIDKIDLLYKHTGQPVPVIKAIDGSLITEKSFALLPSLKDVAICDKDNDILKICVVNRYNRTSPAVGWINNFNLKNCALASTVAHDSHNIIAVGDDDDLIYRAIDLLIQSKGGLSAVSNQNQMHIPLPIAGLMSDQSCVQIGQMYSNITDFVKSNGCTLHAPYMTLSFMALLVIPKIKISDMGMFDAESFTFY